MSVSLKVGLPGGRTKAMRFAQAMSISEVIQDIMEKTEQGGADHGLFLPPIEGVRSGQWLKEDRTIMFYDLQAGDSVELKKKNSTKKISFIR